MLSTRNASGSNGRSERPIGQSEKIGPHLTIDQVCADYIRQATDRRSAEQQFWEAASVARGLFAGRFPEGHQQSLHLAPAAPHSRHPAQSQSHAHAHPNSHPQPRLRQPFQRHYPPTNYYYGQHDCHQTRASRLWERSTARAPAIFRYIFPKNAFLRPDRQPITSFAFSAAIYEEAACEPCTGAALGEDARLEEEEAIRDFFLHQSSLPASSGRNVATDISEALASIAATAGSSDYCLLLDDDDGQDKGGNIECPFPESVPPPLQMDASKPIPDLDLSNDYLQSLHSDYCDYAATAEGSFQPAGPRRHPDGGHVHTS